MRKILLLVLLAGAFMLTACGNDDSDDASPQCLVCEGDSERVCVGDVDEDGNVITLELLQAARDLANGLGGNCSIQ